MIGAEPGQDAGAVQKVVNQGVDRGGITDVQLRPRDVRMPVRTSVTRLGRR